MQKSLVWCGLEQPGASCFASSTVALPAGALSQGDKRALVPACPTMPLRLALRVKPRRGLGQNPNQLEGSWNLDNPLHLADHGRNCYGYG